jgi:chemotaxis signal transduction protein
VTLRATPRFLGFRAGSQTWALPLALVREIVACPPVVPVPGSRPQVAGVALIHGLALPVYDLPSCDSPWGPPAAHGRADPAGAERRLIVCARGDALLGLIGQDVDLLPDRAEDDAAVGAGVTVLDPAKLFASLGVPEDPTGDAMEEDGEEDPAGR